MRCFWHFDLEMCFAPHGQFFISHLARWLRTRRFSEPSFRPSGATNLPFPAPASSFFDFLFSDLLWLFPPLLFHLSILSEVWLLNFLRLYIIIFILTIFLIIILCVCVIRTNYIIYICGCACVCICWQFKRQSERADRYQLRRLSFGEWWLHVCHASCRRQYLASARLHCRVWHGLSHSKFPLVGILFVHLCGWVKSNIGKLEKHRKQRAKSKRRNNNLSIALSASSLFLASHSCKKK